MKINRNNYEAYFIDYLEGNLDENLVNDFIEFIQQNPDLKEEMELINSVTLKPDQAEFDKKEDLYKEKLDIDSEFGRMAIADLEGDLTDSEKKDFEEYLSKHPEKQKDKVLFAKTKLYPDKSIIFNNKSKLRKNSVGRSIFLWAGRAAAILIVALVSYTLILQNSEEILEQPQIAVNEKKVSEESDKSSETVKEEPTEEEMAENQKSPIDKEKDKKSPASKEQIKEIKTPVKKEQPAKEHKSLRENTKGRIEHDLVADVRTPIEAPQRLGTLSAKVKKSEPGPALAAMNYYIPVIREFPEERLIGDVVKEKTGLNDLSLNKITKAGLNLVSAFSKDNLSYETNENGNITEVNFDSRLLAFSIPTNNESGE